MLIEPATVPCPVCRTPTSTLFMTVRERTYHRCPACEATFLLPEQHPTPQAEKARYDQHNNDRDDPKYVTFLRRLADPVLEALARAPEARLPDNGRAGLTGLDFGSGPAPVLAEILQTAGHTVACYDPFYAPDSALLEGSGRYDFITCCEVAEHLHSPADEFERLARLLRPGGLLGIMTEFQTDDERFARWYYREDRTHVVFYREETLQHLAQRLDMSLTIPQKNVALLRPLPRAG